MATAHASAPASSRTSSVATNHPHPESSYTNGHHHHHDGGAPQPSGLATGAKKGKQKKATDPTEASKLIAAKISQLELDQAGEKDQEAEIGWSCPFDIRLCIVHMRCGIVGLKWQKSSTASTKVKSKILKSYLTSVLSHFERSLSSIQCWFCFKYFPRQLIAESRWANWFLHVIRREKSH